MKKPTNSKPMKNKQKLHKKLKDKFGKDKADELTAGDTRLDIAEKIKEHYEKAI